MSYKFNPFTGSLDIVDAGLTQTQADALYVKLDQTTPQTVINGFVTMTEGIKFGINPTLTSTAPGALYWDTTYDTLALNINTAGTTLQIGQETYIKVQAGENIADGDAVYISSVSGIYPVVMKAIASGTDAQARVRGIATEAIASGSQGLITNFGLINGLNTDSFTAGDIVYLSAATAGALTNVKPVPPNIQTVIGRVVVKSATAGSIFRSNVNYPLDANQIDLKTAGTTTDHSVQDFVNTYSAGMISGGTITSTGSQQIAVSAGRGMFAIGSSDTDPIAFASWAALPISATLTDTRATWVTAQYSSTGANIVLIEGSSATDYSVPAAINYQNVFPLGYVTRNGTELYITNNPRRMQDAVGGLNSRFYQTLPLARDEKIGGILLGETGTRNITLSAGKLWDRSNSFTINSIDTSAAGVFSTWYRDAGTGFIETENVTQWPNTQYDNGSGTLQTVAANRYSNLWWYVSTEGALAMVYGRAIYTSAAAAALGAVPSTLPLPIWMHYRLIGRTTFQGSGSAFIANDSSFATIFNPSAVTSHNNLSGLQGGTAAEYYHLTSAQHTTLTPASFANTNGLIYFNGTSIIADTAALTATRIPYAGANGRLTDSANLTYDGNLLTATGDITVTDLLSFDEADWTGGNTYYAPVAITPAALNALIAASSAGDTIVLGAGTYTMNVNLVVGVGVSLVGQGVDKTTIAVGANYISMTASNSALKDLTVTGTGSLVIYPNGVSANISGVRLENINVTATRTGTVETISFDKASGTVRSCKITNTATLSVTGIECFTRDTFAASTVDVYDTDIILANGGGSNNGALYAKAVTGTNVATINAYRCRLVNSGDGANVSGATADTAYSAINIYDSSLSGTDADALQTAGTITLSNCTLANNTTSGTITYAGTIYSTAAKLGYDTDAVSYFGRAAVGYNGTDSDYAAFGHVDNMTNLKYALMQNAAGTTYLNAVSGTNIYINLGGATKATINAKGLSLGANATFATASTNTYVAESGTAPTTSPADAFQMYSADLAGVAGHAGSHIRDEKGGIFAPNAVRTVTDTANILQTDTVVVCNKGTDFTVTLPAATGTGKIIHLKSIGAGIVTIEGADAETIDGAANTTLNQWNSIAVCDYGTGTWVML